MPARKKTARRKAATRKKKAGSRKAPARPSNQFVILLDGSEDAVDAIRLEVASTIVNVVGLHEQLSAALVAGNPVTIDASDVDQVDAAALQLLCSFARHATARNIDVNWRKQSQAFAEASRCLGLDTELGFD